MMPKTITLIPHTHWDREWYEPFELFRAHLVDMLDEALLDLERDERLHFTLDGHAALVDDYLELRPEAEPRIRALVRAGRLHVGPWYTQADTLLVDGEALLRNLVFGLRRAERLGGALRIGYMPDQFGHAAQMPQLLSLLDLHAAVLWRGPGPDRPPHAFRWRAPDGSEVTAVWLQDGYGSGRRIPSDPAGFVAAIERLLDRHRDWLGELPIAIPIGDDHVRLARWLPDVAAALSARHPELAVRIGGYQHHLPALGAVEHVVSGELRSPAFAPVLAGVASARIREKQAAERATRHLLRYAEPLSAWVARLGGDPPTHLLDQAWRYLILNHAHDSAAGCGIDAAHADVQARYRWAEQVARAASERALGQLAVAAPDRAHALVAFVPAGRGNFVVEAELPKSLEGPLIARGPDGIARPVQALVGGDDPPIFEGEFSAEELGQHLGGLDPKTPIFGRYLTGLSAREESPGYMRLDVGLGETPVPPARLDHDQAVLRELLDRVTRFKVVLHQATPTRPVLVQAHSAAEAALVRVVIEPGETEDGQAVREIEAEGLPVIDNHLVRVAVEPDGSVRLTADGHSVRANQLVDEGDRGDLYHFDPIGTPVRARLLRATVTERGPIRARLRIEQALDLPEALIADRSERGAARPMAIVTEVTLTAGERRVDFVTTLTNEHQDHRLRALVELPGRAERLDVEHGLAVLARPLRPTEALGAGAERAAPTGQHHLFVDAVTGQGSVALMSRGLPEHELISDEEGGPSRLALTLLRAVGWLSRGDLSVIDHAAGPMMPTPEAQERGAHRFEYALLLHDGDWRTGGVYDEARRYAAPPIVAPARGSRIAPEHASLVEVTPAAAVMTALTPSAQGPGIVVRVLNTADTTTEVRLAPAGGFREALLVDPAEVPVKAPSLAVQGGAVLLSLRPWQLASVCFR